jgi:hypothetical protein
MDNIKYDYDSKYIPQRVSPGFLIEAPESELVIENLTINRIHNIIALSPLYLNIDSIFI